MNDELLLKLKNAGFPIQQTCGHCGEGYGADVEPTLSELIESCVDSFDSLINIGSFGWRATSFFNVEGNGETPEKAVANLYLALLALE